MGVYAERMEATTVAAMSRDGRIRARATGSGTPRFAFKPGGYRDYTESRLEVQLAELLERLFAAHREARRALLAEVTGQNLEFDKDWDLDRREREYRKQIAELSPIGRSPDRSIKLTHTGMTRWKCGVKPGTVANSSEDEFCRQLSGAVVALRQRHRVLIAGVRLDAYGRDRTTGYS